MTIPFSSDSVVDLDALSRDRNAGRYGIPATRGREHVEVNVGNPCKMRHPVEKLVDQLVAGDLPWSRATSKLGLMITSLSCLQVGVCRETSHCVSGLYRSLSP